ncbi:CoB--CoM heterodisulfide reductase subunit B [Methanobrevibacter filiformis]|uniref:Lactate utilization protein A n=1 Tax=Methanobrevibacter filiformis TaxID=55758 RepID=A0A166C6V5_9EURY|nr:CoB--CoM heterodisulfide reductase subunit B [Methanobrevibacter filiformis]KZX11757.1 lactate utilization protein A [Methanobrevibacter filiformis]
MEIAYFLGCIMNNRYPGIEKATRILFDKLGIKLNDMEGASCCPAPGVFGSFDKKTWASIAARNLTIAEGMGSDLMTECNGCFGSLFEANLELQHDAAFKDEINEVLAEVGKEYKGSINVRHFAEVLYNTVGLDKLAELVENPLNLEVAVHYGCHFLRPSDEIGIDNAEKPTILDDLVEATGARSVPYKDKMMCCGAGGGLRARDIDVTLSITKEKLDNMTDAGVDAIVEVCPFCHMQFDVGQTEVNKKYGTNYNVPVFHLAQLYGLAMGLGANELTLDSHLIDSAPALAKIVEEADKLAGE